MERANKRAQLKQNLLALIRQGGDGAQLPPERELSERLDVARETLRRCLRELELEGLLERRQGAGTFVSGQPVIKQPQLLSFSEDMQARGLNPSSEVLSLRTTGATAKIAQKLQLPPGAPLLEIRRLRMANDEPMALETVYLSKALVAELEMSQLTSGSLYALLHSHFNIQLRSAAQTIQSTVLTEEEAEILEVPPFSPSLLVARVTVSTHGQPIEYAKSLYRADRYRFEVNVERLPAPVDDANTK
ncbi:MAG: GntR family transcriptional regulator [Rhodoferax sp.]|nr:GntR family transcriptional regulator [Rhodoferax sp.]